MKIEKQQLIELLVVKTGLDKKSVEKQLEELVNRIKDAADRGKALEVKGFGLFYYSEGGDLKFDPSEEFKTEVNFKYAGMEPIEVQEGVPEEELDEILSEEEDLPDIGEEVEDADIWGVENGKDPDEKSVSTKEEEPADDDLKSGTDEAAAEEEIITKEKRTDTEGKEESPDEETEEAAAPNELKETEDTDITSENDSDKETKNEELEKDAPEKKEPEKDDRFADLIGSAFDSLKDEEEKPEEESGVDEDIFAAGEDPFDLDKDEAGQEPLVPERKASDAGDKKESAEKKHGIPVSSKSRQESKPVTAGKEQASSGKTYKRKEQEQGIPINTIIVSVTVFLIIVVGYFVVSDLTQPEAGLNSPANVAQQDLRRNGQTPQAGETTVEDDAGSAQTEPAETEDDGEESGIPEEPVTDSATDNQAQNETGIQDDNESETESVQEENPEMFGLTGPVNDSVNSGFTIIVHSLTEESRAIEVMEQLRNEGYRAMIFARNIQDRGTVWRVGIGQFENRDIALETATGLPEPYNENHFIQRIQ